MEKDNSSQSHHKTKTTVRFNASHPLFSCGFFCNRDTNSDVINPADTKPKVSEELTKPTLGS